MPTLPGAIITWTSTGTASMPWKATVRTRATILLCPHYPPAGPAIRRRAGQPRQPQIFGLIKNITRTNADADWSNGFPLDTHN